MGRGLYWAVYYNQSLSDARKGQTMHWGLPAAAAKLALVAVVRGYPTAAVDAFGVNEAWRVRITRGCATVSVS